MTNRMMYRSRKAKLARWADQLTARGESNDGRKEGQEDDQTLTSHPLEIQKQQKVVKKERNRKSFSGELDDHSRLLD